MSLGRRIGTVTLLNVGANLAAIGKNATIAARFGVSGTADLVAYGEAILLFLPTILLVRECFGLFVSVYGRLLESEGDDAAAPLFCSGLRIVALIGAALSLTVLLVPGGLMRLIAPGLSPRQLETGAWLLRAVSPALILTEIAEFTRTVHNTHHRYLVPGLVTLGGNLLQAAVLIILPVERALIAWVLAINGAALLQAVLLAGLAPGISLRRLASGAFLHPELRVLARLVAPVAGGVLLVQIAGYIERVVLSYLPAGSLALLAYARKLIAPLQTVLAASVALPIYVQMSRSKAGDVHNRTKTFSKGIEINLLLFVPITLFVLLLAPQMVDLVFRRGLFGLEDVASTTPLLRIGVLAILPASLLLLLRDFFYASAGTRPLVLGAAIHLACTAIANLTLARRFGVSWVPAGVVAGTWATCICLLMIVRPRLAAIDGRSILRNGIAVLAGGMLAAATAVGALTLFRQVSPTGPIRMLLEILVAGAVGFVVYAVVLRAFGHPLARRVVERLREGR